MAEDTHREVRTYGWFPPRGPFTSDLHGAEAWSWGLVPLVMLALLVACALYAPAWYLRWLQPEGYGVLELLHFFIPAATAALAIATLRYSWVRSTPVLLIWIVMLALGCIYIAGEEHSWGQHFFKWSTPEYWSGLNRQDETNLHNVSGWFGKLPRTLLTVGIVVMGFIYPLCVLLWPGLNARNPIAICMPPLPLLSTALCVIVIKTADYFGAMIWLGQPAVRLSEMSETFIYLFLFLGALVLRRRVIEVSSEHAPQPSSAPASAQSDQLHC